MHRPVEYNTNLYQGSVFRRVFTYKNPDGSLVNLTGYTARMQVRSQSTGALQADLTSSPAAGITLGGVAGTVTIRIGATATALYTWNLADYSVELTPPSGADDTFAFVEGILTNIREHTR